MANEKKLVYAEDARKVVSVIYMRTADYRARGPLWQALEDLEKLAPVNAVEVVRCKDCKYCRVCYPEKQIGKEATEGWYCKEHKSYRRPDDFCSYGERKDNG